MECGLQPVHLGVLIFWGLFITLTDGTKLSGPHEVCLKQPVDLTCAIPYGERNKSITWHRSRNDIIIVTCKRNGKCYPISPNYNVISRTPSKQVLRIFKFRVEDAGNWTCRAEGIPTEPLLIKSLESPASSSLKVRCDRDENTDNFRIECEGLTYRGSPPVDLLLNVDSPDAKKIKCQDVQCKYTVADKSLAGAEITCSVFGQAAKCIKNSAISVSVRCPGTRADSNHETVAIIMSVVVFLSSVWGLLFYFTNIKGTSPTRDGRGIEIGEQDNPECAPSPNLTGSATGLTGGSVRGNVYATAQQIIQQQVINNSSIIQDLEDATNRLIDRRTQGMIERSLCDEIIEKIKEGKHWTSLVGNAGDGKTTLGYMVLKKLKENGFKVFVVNSPNDCRSVMRMEDNKYVMMFDDVFGATDFDSFACTQWRPIIEEFLHDSKRSEKIEDLPYMLFITRAYIMKKAKSQFSRHEDVMFSEQSLFDLGKMSNEDELDKIITYHLQKKNITDVDEDSKRRAIQAKQQHGIPHTSELYSEIRSKGNCIDICEFFKSPLKFLNMTMKAFVENTDTKDLFRRLLSSNGLLKLIEIKDEQKREHARKTAQPLEGSYITNQLECISWAHPSIMESFVVIYGRNNPEFIVNNCDFSLLSRRVKVKDQHSEESDEYLFLQPAETVLTALCARFKSELQRGHYRVLGHDFCRKKVFFEMLLDEFLSKEKVDKKAVEKLHINETGSARHSPLLHAAVLSKNDTAVDCLLRRNANVNETGRDGKTALHWALRQDPAEIKIIQLLILAKPDVNIIDGGGYTPLHCLCQNTSVNAETFAALLEAGANLNLGRKGVYTPLHYLCKNTSVTTELLAALLKANPYVNSGCRRIPQPLHFLCKNTCVTTGLLAELLKGGANVNSGGKGGTTPLHYLCKNTKVTAGLLAELLKGGADVENCDKDGYTPLHYLCENTSLTAEMLSLLLKFGADDSRGNTFGLTPHDCLRDNTTVAEGASEMMKRAKALVKSHNK